ncbi:hypothetical protein [Hydrocarboniphaga effusa]|uniref:hypothetical protein n=1 Tax=Hydrocarboniphaga effusa TaxID=243629 RepID=UPI003BAA33BE
MTLQVEPPSYPPQPQDGTNFVRDLSDAARILNEDSETDVVSRGGVVHPTLKKLIAQMWAYVTTAVGSLTASVSGALASANAAAASAVAAAGSAQTSLAASNKWDTVELGRSHVVDGQHYLVSTADPQVALEYRRDSAGASTLIGPVRIADGARFVVNSSSRSLHEFRDAAGRVYARFRPTDAGLLLTGMARSVQQAFADIVSYRYTSGASRYLDEGIDSSGRRYRYFRRDGHFFIPLLGGKSVQQAIADMKAPTAYLTGGRFRAQIVHILGYGQSLSRGVQSVPLRLVSQLYDCLRFIGGVRPDDTTPSHSSLVPMIETQQNGNAEFPGTTYGETPSTAMGHMLKELIASVYGILHTQQQYQPLFSVDGEGSKTIAQLSSPSVYFTRLATSIEQGYARAQELGKSYNVPLMTMMHGESDYTAGTAGSVYGPALETLRQQVDTKAKAVSGQVNAVKLLMYQPACHKARVYAGNPVTYPSIALAQLKASQDYEHIALAMPMYSLTHLGDNVHLPALSEDIAGGYFAAGYLQWEIQGVKPKPLQVIEWSRQGGVLLLRFNPVGKLVRDTTIVAANDNDGQALRDPSNNPIAISSVEIVGNDMVRVWAPAGIAAGSAWQNAFYGSGTTGPLVGPRANIRDTRGDDPRYRYEPTTGIDYPLHNWSVIQELIL